MAVPLFPSFSVAVTRTPRAAGLVFVWRDHTGRVVAGRRRREHRAGSTEASRRNIEERPRTTARDLFALPCWLLSSSRAGYGLSCVVFLGFGLVVVVVFVCFLFNVGRWGSLRGISGALVLLLSLSSFFFLPPTSLAWFARLPCSI